MEKPRFFDERIIDAFRGKNIVDAGIVEDDAVHAGKSQDDGVGTALPGRHAEALGSAVGAEELGDDLPEVVLADLRHEKDLEAQFFHRDPGIGDGASRAENGFPDIQQFSGGQEDGYVRGAFLRDLRRDVQAQ